MRRPNALGLDFAGPPYPTGSGGWLLLLVGVVCLLAAAFDWQDSRDETSRWQDEAARWQRAAQRAGRGSAAGATTRRPEVEAAAKALARLTIPWGALYRCLEDKADADVSLLAILPNADKGELRVNGEARDFAALRRYLQRLGESDVLADVRLQSNDVRESDAQKPVVFSIVAAWRAGS
ncbi:MAG TPA: PilN domain-containing protein [Rhodocyclaceae bacterium]|nr:PilN domain-containing protein [Rhodocyclaceae bacterium]